jgi:two-component system, NarL family, nitrate/nitrite response regulator NarL
MSEMKCRPIRLFLIDDHELFAGGLAHLLAAQPDFQVVGFANNLADARRTLATDRPDVILLDVDLGRDRAIDFLRDRGAAVEACGVLIVTAGISEFEAVQLIHAGARGVFHKHHPPQELYDAVRQVASGNVILEPQYLRGLFGAIDPQAIDPRPRLGERETAVLRLLLQGLGNKEIAAELQVSESAVKAILRGLFDKMSVRTRSQLVKVALDEYRDIF